MYLRQLNSLTTYPIIFAKPRYPPFWLLALRISTCRAQTAAISHYRLMSVCLQVKNRLHQLSCPLPGVHHLPLLVQAALHRLEIC